jgi:hypothetical protein
MRDLGLGDRPAQKLEHRRAHIVVRLDRVDVTEQRTRVVPAWLHGHDLDASARSFVAADALEVERLRKDINLSDESLRDTLEVALGLEVGQPRLSGPDDRGRFELTRPIPPQWKNLVDDELRLPATHALPHLVFDPKFFIETRLGRPVFRPSKDTVLLHLGHSMFRHALAKFARLRFPGSDERLAASRWSVRRGVMPKGADALVLLTVEEMAINNLREPFHHWVRTLRIPLIGDELGKLTTYVQPSDDTAAVKLPSKADILHARELWETIGPDVRDVLAKHRQATEALVAQGLDQTRDQRIAEADATFATRIEEVREAMRKNTIKNLEKDLAKLQRQSEQGFLFPQLAREHAEKLANLEEEIARRTLHYEELLKTLQRERERMVKRFLPERFKLRDGGVQVFPLTVEIRLPGVRA